MSKRDEVQRSQRQLIHITSSALILRSAGNNTDKHEDMLLFIFCTYVFMNAVWSYHSYIALILLYTPLKDNRWI